MPENFTAAAIQMNSGDNVPENLARAQKLFAQAADGGAKLAALVVRILRAALRL